MTISISKHLARQGPPGGQLPGGASWQLPSGHYIPAKMSMTAVFPRPDAETNTYARQRLAYADGATQYRIPIAIQGGAYPFHYSLAVSPTPSTSMTIGQDYGQVDYGIVTWTPQASDIGQTYTATVTVTDQDSNTTSVTWSVTATTSNFVFVDPTAATNGTGTKASPFNSTVPLFVEHISVTSSPYANDVVYFRGGTTTLVGPETDAASKAGNVQLQDNKNPITWLGYPGDASPVPTVDFSGSKVIVDNQNDVYFGGLNIANARTDVTDASFFFFNQNAAQDRATFFENNFSNIQDLSGGDSNQAAITLFNPGILRKYFTLMGCTLNNYTAELVDVYAVKYGVIENNKLLTGNGTSPWAGIFLKSDSQNFSVRRNVSLSQSFNYGAIWIMGQAQVFTNDNIEVCYNLILSGNSSKPAFIYEWTGPGGSNNTNEKIYAYRNTFYGWIGGNFDYPFTITEENNVLIDDSGKNATMNISGSGGVQTVIKSNNLEGTSSDGYIDSAGNLTGTYTQYIGTHGYQI